MASHLEQQLANLKLCQSEAGPQSASHVKKAGPAVPPKPKKPQPQVVLSY